MQLLTKMFALCANKFENKTDKAGMPYMLHLIYVMQNCGLKDENSMCIALGHDLIEDTDVTFEYIKNEFNEEIALSILTLTRSKEETYNDYIRRISSHNILISIKIADLEHNMQVYRITGRRLDKKDFERIERYHQAYSFLLRNRF